MGNSLADNLDDLIDQYCNRTRAIEAVMILQKVHLRGSSGGGLFETLRITTESDLPIAGTDYTLQPFDRLLDFYGIIEIASVFGVVPSPLPKDFCVDAIEMLDDPVFERYYRQTPGRYLARQFRERVSKRRSVAPLPIDASILFFRFLDLNVTFGPNSEVFAFLKSLDRSRDDDTRLRTVLAQMEDPHQMAEAYRDESLVPILSGYQAFVSFCTELDRLLVDAEKVGNIASICLWQYFAPYFEPLADRVSAFVNAANERLLLWARAKRPIRSLTMTETRAVEEIKSEILETAAMRSTIISRVTNGTVPRRMAYGQVLNQIAENDSSRNLKH